MILDHCRLKTETMGQLQNNLRIDLLQILDWISLRHKQGSEGRVEFKKIQLWSHHKIWEAVECMHGGNGLGLAGEVVWDSWSGVPTCLGSFEKINGQFGIHNYEECLGVPRKSGLGS